MQSRTILWVVLALVVVAGLGYAGMRLYQSRQGDECAACRRPMHHGAKTVAMVNGKRLSYCCPACAVSEHQQSGARVEVSTLTDQLTGKQISPSKAFLVRGSDVNPCARHAETLRPDKHPMEAHYDRCAPSMLAFSSRETATQFAREHGGQVVPFSTLAAEYR